jgi:hypothetical protein
VPDDVETLKVDAARQENRQARAEIDRLQNVAEYVQVVRAAHDAHDLPGVDLADAPAKEYIKRGLSLEEAKTEADDLARRTKEWVDEQTEIAVNKAVADVHREHCVRKPPHRPFRELEDKMTERKRRNGTR